MTDDFDLQLRDRLGTLASTVPVIPPNAVGHVMRPAVRAGSAGRRWSLAGPVPIVAVVVAAMLLGGLLTIGLGGRGDGEKPVVASVQDGPFELTIRSAQGRYDANEPIEVEAALAYRGPDSEVLIGHASGSPMAFGIREPVDGVELEPVWRLSCGEARLLRNDPLTKAFAKSGGWASEPGQTTFDAFMKDPVLRLSARTWHIYVIASFTQGGCGAGDVDVLRVRHEMEAEIEIVVGPSPTTSPAAATPIGLLTVAGPHGDACLTARATGRLARDPISGLGLSLDGAVRPIRWPFGFTADAGPDGAILYDDHGAIYAREGDELSFGGGEGPDQIFAVCSPFPTTTLDPSPATETVDPSQPAVDTAVDGLYSLELRASRRTFVENEPIDIGATFRYSGETPITITHGANGWIGFGIRERVYGVQLGPSWLTSCGPTELSPGFEKVQPFTKSGGVSANDPDHELKMAFLQDPELRLPPGVWHIVAIAAFAEAPACGGHRAALDTEIEIEVLPAPLITNPPPTFPDASAGPIQPDGSVLGVSRDDTFELRIGSPQAVHLAGQPIDVHTTLESISAAFIEFGHSMPPVFFGIEQINGRLQVGGGAADVCLHSSFVAGAGEVIEFSKSGGYSQTDPDIEWKRQYLDDPLLRLPAGTWRIWASFHGSVPDCGDTLHRLHASIVIKVVPQR